MEMGVLLMISFTGWIEQMIIVSLEHTAKLWTKDCVRMTERIIVVNEARQNSNRTGGTWSADDVGLLAPPVNTDTPPLETYLPGPLERQRRSLQELLGGQPWNRVTST